MNPDIDQEGFERPKGKVTQIKNEASSSTISSSEQVAEKKRSYSLSDGNLLSKRNAIIGGSAVALVVLLGGIYFFGNSDGVVPKNQSNSVSSGNPFTSNQPLSDPKIEIDQEGVTINGERDQLASLLLQNYPTRSELQTELERIRGAEVSQEELDVFLLAVKHNSEAIARLDSKPQVDLSRLTTGIDDMKASLQSLKGEVSGIRETLQSNSEKIDKLEKNSGWYHNRISALEGDPVKVKTKPRSDKSATQSTSRRLQMTTESSWVVNGASSNLAFISNTNTNKKLRVTIGFDIPGCGQVTHIDPSEQKVVATSCVIKN